MQDFIYTYYIKPIENYEGYNIINTTTYALIALIALYLFYKLTKDKIELRKPFLYGGLAFTAFGSLKRVVTDAVDRGEIGGIIGNVYEYNIFNVSPFIYIFVGFLFILTFMAEKKLNKKFLTAKIGLLLSLIHLMILLPLTKYPYMIIVPLIISLAIYLIASKILGGIYALPVFAHTLDGISSTLAITSLSYGEQHVVANLLFSINPWVFPLVKTIVAALFSYYLSKEKDEHMKDILLLAATVMGLAPGIRNSFRAALAV